MQRPSCPRCGGEKFVSGQCAGSEGIAPYFVPAQTRRFRLKFGVPLATSFGACVTCGYLWGAVAPGSLRSFIEQYGNEVARQDLERLDAGIMPGLTDTEAGRATAAILAALDQLVLHGKEADLPERFRAFMGVTWEEALKATRKWQHLTRAEKLQRLGWVEKKGPRDDLAEPLL